MTRRTLLASLAGAPVAAELPVRSALIDVPRFNLFALQKRGAFYQLIPSRVEDCEDGLWLYDCLISKSRGDRLLHEWPERFDLLESGCGYRPVTIRERYLVTRYTNPKQHLISLLLAPR